MSTLLNSSQPDSYLFRNLRLLDPRFEELRDGYEVMVEHIPISLLAARAAPLMLGMLNRGFTTVRDTGGADWGIKEAVAKGHLVGPRLFISGRAIGPTGGHSDMRRRTDTHEHCRCCDGLHFTMAIADGNPLTNLELFQNQGEHLSLIMKERRIHKTRL